MFFGKEPGTFAKHLPAATRAALEKAGATASLQQYSLLMNQFQTQGQHLQMFEAGSVLLTAEDPKTGQKIEITVEEDTLRGEFDDIGLTLRHVAELDDFEKRHDNATWLKAKAIEAA